MQASKVQAWNWISINSIGSCHPSKQHILIHQRTKSSISQNGKPQVHIQFAIQMNINVNQTTHPRPLQNCPRNQVTSSNNIEDGSLNHQSSLPLNQKNDLEKQDAAKSYNSKVQGIAGDNKLRGYGWFPKDLRENVREKNIEEK